VEWGQLIPIITLVTGIVGAVFIALRFQREEAGKTVEQHAAVFGSYRDLIDELEEALTRCRGDRKHHEDEIAVIRAQLSEANGDRQRLQLEKKQLEANLRACIHRQEILEQRLIELGEGAQ
jgi:chromosome segregation ATPase